MQNIGVRNGLLGAVVVIFFFAIVYFVRPALFLNPWLQWSSLVIYLIFMYKAAQEDCALLGTSRDFREIVRTPFVVFLLVNLGYWLFYYGIHLKDSSLIVMELQAKIDFLQQQLTSGAGNPDTANDLRLQIADLEKAKASPVQPLAPILAQMAQGALGGFGLATGVALLLRGKE